MRLLLVPCLAVALATLACGREPAGVCAHSLALTVVVTPATRTLLVGDTATFRARIPAEEPCPGEQLAPRANRFVWSVQNAAVATVTATSDSTARVQAVTAGQTTVIASWAEQPSVGSAGLVTVAP